MITLRIQSPEGQKRVQVDAKSSMKIVFDKVSEVMKPSSAFTLYRDREKKQMIEKSQKKVSDLGIKHGDVLHFHTTVNGTKSEPDGMMKREVKLQEDDIDVLLKGKDGKIARKRDPKLCRHNDNASCLFCCPLEPFDDNYLKELNIRHLSFHSYLKKLTSGIDKGKFAALEDMNVRIKDGCTSHPPWPKGICSKCQPSAVTLNLQRYRHVDNVMFENPAIVERFLSYWKASGHQRVGFLFGRYEEFTDVPLGIRARVACIYEPPQETTKNSIVFLNPDERWDIVKGVADELGLSFLGWIFTDLVPEANGSVKCTRGIHSHFLSASECITAAHLQNLHPNVCSLAPSGTFGSKSVTVLVSGDEGKQIAMAGYQVSSQAMALERENVLLPTIDAPELGYVKESSEKQFVPDVFYTKKDEYGNEVKKIAQPLPVEYLLVDVPVSTPNQPMYSFHIPVGINPFPVENRLIDGQLQDFGALSVYLEQFGKDRQFLDLASDFHFLIYLATMEIGLNIRESLGALLEAVRTENYAKANEWAAAEVWATVEQLVAASGGSAAAGSSRGIVGAAWTCAHCTFINQASASTCEVCQLPK